VVSSVVCVISGVISGDLISPAPRAPSASAPMREVISGFISRVIGGDPISPALLLARACRVVLGTLRRYCLYCNATHHVYAFPVSSVVSFANWQSYWQSVILAIRDWIRVGMVILVFDTQLYSYRLKANQLLKTSVVASSSMSSSSRPPTSLSTSSSSSSGRSTRVSSGSRAPCSSVEGGAAPSERQSEAIKGIQEAIKRPLTPRTCSRRSCSAAAMARCASRLRLA
jgi:hypothetical protein